jgi:MYXO-CTERM domain-containing protein
MPFELARPPRALIHLGAAAFAMFVASGARAATIRVTPSDSYDAIENAAPGDEVVIAPGTYGFRVYLETVSTADAPLVIRAEDPQNPPVWDLSAGNVEDQPGSYTAGDRGRGCWQLSGAENVRISDIVITECHNASHNSAGLRYYSGSRGIVLSNVVFRNNDNRLTGGTEDSEITVEFSEFDQNGSLLAPESAPSHNIYIYGGTFTLRHSFVHDPIQSQNFHIRAHDALIEYNWIARAKSYAGDLMTDDDNDGSGPQTQTMTLRGNVIVQGDDQANGSQIVAVYNDGGASDLTLDVRLLYNTFVGNGGRAALVHLSNEDGTRMSAVLENNVIFGTDRPTIVDDTAAGTVTGRNNWLMTGADSAGLTGSVFGDDPGFSDMAGSDFTLGVGSTAIDAALSTVADAPDREYFRDEVDARMFRVRASVNDIGAFESTTTGDGTGPHDPVPPTGGTGGTGGGGGSGLGGTATTGGGTGTGGAATGGAATGAAPSGGSATGGNAGNAQSGGASGTTAVATEANDESPGCGCRSKGPPKPLGTIVVTLVAILFVGRRRRRP